jgi:hypothetical protein
MNFLIQITIFKIYGNRLFSKKAKFYDRPLFPFVLSDRDRFCRYTSWTAFIILRHH